MVLQTTYMAQSQSKLSDYRESVLYPFNINSESYMTTIGTVRDTLEHSTYSTGMWSEDGSGKRDIDLNWDDAFFKGRDVLEMAQDCTGFGAELCDCVQILDCNIQPVYPVIKDDPFFNILGQTPGIVIVCVGKDSLKYCCRKTGRKQLAEG